MVLKSPYPDLPPLPEVNAHIFYCRRPDQAQWPDFPLHIDIETGEKVLRKEFLSRVDTLSTGLYLPPSDGGLEIGEGEMVGIMGDNSTEYITLIHALLRNTTPFALISSLSTPFELKHALNLMKVTSLFVDGKLLDRVAPVAKKCGVKEDRLFVLCAVGKDKKNPRSPKGHKSVLGTIHEVKKRGHPIIPVRPAKKDTLAYLILSSGTSGLPKAVMISHGNLIYCSSQFILITQDALAKGIVPCPTTLPCVLAALPLHHTFGLHAFALRGMQTPQTLVIAPKWNIKQVLKSIPKYKITTLPLVPSVAHQIVTYPGIDKVDMSSVSAMTSGAAYLPPKIYRQMKQLIPGDVRFLEGFGMSEVTMGAILQPLHGHYGLKHIVGCLGVLLPGMEARVVREDGTDVNVREPGELWLRGGNIALGYWNNEKANTETFVDGWLRTGDRFYLDEDGYFWYADRVKDTLKVSGAQVSPNEIEDCLLAQPDKLILDVSVAGVSGGRTFDEKIPRAWVVLSPAGKKLGKGAVVKALDAWHREHLSSYKHLRGGIEVVDSIPKSPTGKTLRRVLQDRYEARVKKKTKAKL